MKKMNKVLHTTLAFFMIVLTIGCYLPKVSASDTDTYIIQAQDVPTQNRGFYYNPANAWKAGPSINEYFTIKDTTLEEEPNEIYYEVHFDGIQIELKGFSGPSNTIVNISVDSGEPIQIDTYSAVRPSAAISYWKSDILPEGNHIVRVSASGKSNTAARAGGVMQISQAVITREAAAATSLRFSKEEYTIQPSSQLQLDYILLPEDSVKPSDLNFSSSDETIATVDNDGLVTAISSGNAKITASSQKQNFTVETSVKVPYAYTIHSQDITGDSDKFTYIPSNAWKAGAQINEYYTSMPVNQFENPTQITYTVDFYGDSITLFGYKAPAHGEIVDVYIDDEKQGSFDSYAATRTKADVPLWSISDLTSKKHVLKVTATGQKNPSASNDHIEVTKAVITYEPQEAEDIQFENEEYQIYRGYEKTLSYQFLPELSKAPADLRFVSENSQIVEVDENCTILAKKEGTTYIIAESKAFTKKIKITVLPANEDMDATFVDSGDQYQQKAYVKLQNEKVLNEQVWAWQNDQTVSEIAVLSKGKALENISVSSSDLENGEHRIAADHIELSFVKEVEAFIGHAGWYANNNSGTMPSGPKEKFPEVIYSNDPVSIDSKTLQLIWVKASVPKNTVAGVYTGTITVTAENTSDTIELAFAVEVVEAVQPEPEEYLFDVEYWSHPYNVSDYYDVEPFSQEHIDILRQHMEVYKNLGGHAITASIVEEAWGGQTYGKGDIHYPSMIKWVKKSDGTWEFDYHDFDAWVELNKDIGIADKIVCYSMLPWNGTVQYFDEASNAEKRMMASGSDKDAYAAVWRPFLEDFVKHLDDKGWFDSTYIGYDERSNMKTSFDLIDEIKNKDGNSLRKSAAFNDIKNNRAVLDRLDYASVGLQQIRDNMNLYIDL